MSKLFKLKRWLTIAESAKHLSMVFGEEVVEADILRLALDSQLTLSVVFHSGVLASLCVPVVDDGTLYRDVIGLKGETIRIPFGGQVVESPNGSLMQIQDRVFSLDRDSPFSLPMMGGEVAAIKRRYWNLVGEAPEETTNIDGTFVVAAGRLFQLKSSLELDQKNEFRQFFPIGDLPTDVAIVVQTSDLLDLGKSISDAPSAEEKPVGTKERNTLLAIIGVLCKEARIDHTKHSKAAGLIESTASKMGVSIAETTIENHLKNVADALRSRTA